MKNKKFIVFEKFLCNFLSLEKIKNGLFTALYKLYLNFIEKK